MGSGSGACAWRVLMKCFSWASKCTAVGGGRKCQIRDARGLLGSLSGVNRTPGGPVGLISTICTLLDPSNRSWFEVFSQICQIPPIIGCIQYKIMKTPIKRHFFFVFSRFLPQNPPKTPGNPFLGWHSVWVTTEMAHRRKNNKNYIKNVSNPPPYPPPPPGAASIRIIRIIRSNVYIRWAGGGKS